MTTPAKTKDIPYIGVRKVRGGFKGEITVNGKKVRRPRLKHSLAREKLWQEHHYGILFARISLWGRVESASL